MTTSAPFKKWKLMNWDRLNFNFYSIGFGERCRINAPSERAIIVINPLQLLPASRMIYRQSLIYGWFCESI